MFKVGDKVRTTRTEWIALSDTVDWSVGAGAIGEIVAIVHFKDGDTTFLVLLDDPDTEVVSIHVRPAHLERVTDGQENG